ncbi:MAG: hypothetical protein P4L22_01970 [Candidatus Babeliales bacterium]|nr:hypothetical protein [Candidatus Babeliales bacterium]
MKKILISLLIFIQILGTVETDKLEVEKIGNFALSSSQQPGPLIGFGQNIIDKGDLQVFLYADWLRGRQKKFTEVSPSVLYGISDDLSIFIEQSIVLNFKLTDPITGRNFVAKGLDDLLIQFEYAFYNKETETYANQFTIVPAITFPTGTTNLSDLVTDTMPIGVGSPSFFLGFTACHMATDWYYFAAFGPVLTTSHKNTKFGNQFLYQLGLSKNISYETDKYIFNWMIELDGAYRQRNKILGIIDCNSGGNEIILGPSLWYSNQHFILQAGISWFIYQQFFGTQNKDTFFAAIDIGWKF